MIDQNLSLSELEQLAARISGNANKLSWYLQSNELPQPSFEPDAPVKVLPATAPESAHILRQKLKEDALKLFRLASGPEEYVSHISLNHQYTVCLRYLNHFNILRLIPNNGSISISNLSVVSSAPLPQLTAVIKMALTSGLFSAPSIDRVAHNATSRLLATNEFGAWATCVSQYMFDASAKLPQANERWRRSQDPVHSAFNMAFNTDLPFPEYLAQHPSMARDMGNFVRATQQLDANALRHLLHGFAWQSMGEATVVDVGCSSAYPSIALAKAFPLLKFELQVAPRAVADVSGTISALDPAIKSRIGWNTHSMLSPQVGVKQVEAPERKVFLLRHVLHNLPKIPSSNVINNIIPVMTGDDRIIIMDLVLPGPEELDPYQEGMIRMRDIIQRAMANGATRDESEWGDVVGLAKGNAKILKVTRPAGSDLSILEIGIETGAERGIQGALA